MGILLWPMSLHSWFVESKNLSHFNLYKCILRLIQLISCCRKKSCFCLWDFKLMCCMESKYSYKGLWVCLMTNELWHPAILAVTNVLVQLTTSLFLCPEEGSNEFLQRHFKLNESRGTMKLQQRCLLIRVTEGDAAYSVRQSYNIITDSICSNSRSVPNIDSGNCLFVFFIWTGLALPLSFGVKYIKVLTGMLFTLGRYLDTKTVVLCREICRKFQTPCSTNYNVITVHNSWICFTFRQSYT